MTDRFLFVTDRELAVMQNCLPIHVNSSFSTLIPASPEKNRDLPGTETSETTQVFVSGRLYMAGRRETLRPVLFFL